MALHDARSPAAPAAVRTSDPEPLGEAFVRAFFQHVLQQEPPPAQLRQLSDAVAEHANDPAGMLKELATSPQVRARLGVPARWPAGHYYSPVVSPRTVEEYVRAERRKPVDRIAGVPIDLAAMRELWLQHLDYVRTTPFRDEPTEGNRFHVRGGPYPMGDAIILRMMIRHLQPRRILEIGSGYTTACLLDSITHANLQSVELVCVEPNADRMRSLLWKGDLDRIRLLERPIQDVPGDIVDMLGSGDLLLIDSTHVLKTGSDVYHEFFNLLPRLEIGVVIHVHDIMPGFEYPDAWIQQENYSWNECYALRAFLMYNSDFKVKFWNGVFARTFARELKEECPILFPNPGSAIWIERRARMDQAA